MQSSAIDGVTKLIQSPPGALVAGSVLGGIVWKTFDKADTILKPEKRQEISGWLSGKKTSPSDGPSALLRLFWSVCGASSSRKRLIAITALAMANDLLSGISIGAKYNGAFNAAVETLYFGFSFVLIAIVLDANERILSRTFHVRTLLRSLFAVAMALVVGITAIILVTGISFSRALSSSNLNTVALRLSVVPALTVSIWMWLPAASGLLLKVARHFNVGFDWFSRYADIEKKPLQSIGFVAGPLVALIYWAVAIVSRMMK
jgi:hypothetical protein